MNVIQTTLTQDDMFPSSVCLLVLLVVAAFVTGCELDEACDPDSDPGCADMSDYQAPDASTNTDAGTTQDNETAQRIQFQREFGYLNCMNNNGCASAADQPTVPCEPLLMEERSPRSECSFDKPRADDCLIELQVLQTDPQCNGSVAVVPELCQRVFFDCES